MELYPYQLDGANAIRAAYVAGFKAPLAVFPTGAGKTVLFSYIAHHAAKNGNRTVICCHRIELIRQTCKALRKFGVVHGVIHPDHAPDYTALVQVASVQTLVRRIDKLPFSPFFLVYDEAHHGTAGQWKAIRQRWNSARVLGVTATPIRTDGQGLGATHQGGVFDTMILGPQVSELIEMGYLVRPDVYAPASKIDLSLISIRDGDFDVKELAERVDKADVTGDAVTHYAALAGGAPAVAFCVSVAHAEHVAAQFAAAGYSAHAVSAQTNEKKRRRILAGLGNGTVQIVASCDLISEGTDIPELGAAILLRPTQSLGLYIQQVGRALRVCEGKERAVILDHCGNVLLHGMPDEDREWTLDGLVKERKAQKGQPQPPARVVTCPKCFAVHSPAPACIRCGEVYPVAVEVMKPVADGELTLITPEIRARILSAKEIEIANARTLADLEILAKLRNWPSGWAKHTYQMRELTRSPKLEM